MSLLLQLSQPQPPPPRVSWSSTQHTQHTAITIIHICPRRYRTDKLQLGQEQGEDRRGEHRFPRGFSCIFFKEGRRERCQPGENPKVTDRIKRRRIWRFPPALKSSLHTFGFAGFAATTTVSTTTPHTLPLDTVEKISAVEELGSVCLSGHIRDVHEERCARFFATDTHHTQHQQKDFWRRRQRTNERTNTHTFTHATRLSLIIISVGGSLLCDYQKLCKRGGQQRPLTRTTHTIHRSVPRGLSGQVFVRYQLILHRQQRRRRRGSRRRRREEISKCNPGLTTVLYRYRRQLVAAIRVKHAAAAAAPVPDTKHTGFTRMQT